MASMLVAGVKLRSMSTHDATESGNSVPTRQRPSRDGKHAGADCKNKIAADNHWVRTKGVGDAELVRLG